MTIPDITTISYGAISLYVLLGGVIIGSLIVFTVATLALFKYIENIFMSKTFDKNNGKGYKWMRRSNWWKRVTQLTCGFFVRLIIFVGFSIALLCTVKWIVSDGDMIILILTAMLFTMQYAISLYIVKVSKRKDSIFEERVKVGQKIVFDEIEGIVVDKTLTNFTIKQTGDDESTNKCNVTFDFSMLDNKKRILIEDLCQYSND